MVPWETRHLSELCTIKPPKAEARARLAADCEVSFAPMEVLGIDTKFMMPTAARRLAEVSGSYTYFAEGDVLVAKITPCFENGKLGIARGLVNGVGFGSSEFIVLRPGSKLDREYLYYYLYRPEFRKAGARTMTGAVGHKRISAEFIEQLLIPLPSVSEQRRIVAILDEAFDAIATAKAITEESRQRARSVFDARSEAIFSRQFAGWHLHGLTEVCEIISPLVDPRDLPYLDQIHVGAGNIEAKTGHLLNLRTAREEQLISGKFPFDESMVLYSKIRPYLMKVARPDFSGICSADVYPLKPVAGKLDRDFLFYLLLSRSFTDYAMKGSQRAGMPKVNRDHLFRFRARMPAIAEQAGLAAQLDTLAGEVERLEVIYTTRLAALDELKKSLLHQAFTGQLTAMAADRQLEAVA